MEAGRRVPKAADDVPGNEGGQEDLTPPGSSMASNEKYEGTVVGGLSSSLKPCLGWLGMYRQAWPCSFSELCQRRAVIALKGHPITRNLTDCVNFGKEKEEEAEAEEKDHNACRRRCRPCRNPTEAMPWHGLFAGRVAPARSTRQGTGSASRPPSQLLS